MGSPPFVGQKGSHSLVEDQIIQSKREGEEENNFNDLIYLYNLIFLFVIYIFLVIYFFTFHWLLIFIKILCIFTYKKNIANYFFEKIIS